MRKKKISKPASRVIILGEGRDEWDHRFFKFAVRGSQSNIPPFSAQEIMDSPNVVFGELADAGANTFRTSARNELLSQLDERKREAPKFKVVTRLGWNSGAFVLPNKIIGQPSTVLEPSFRHLDQPLLAKYRVKGKGTLKALKDWQSKIGRLCSGNSRLMFCASLGLTGPILPLVGGPRSGGFQLFGLAKSGKTAAAMVTGSIWGCHRSPERRENGFAENWHTTAGKVEMTALAHNETVLILDETKRAGQNDKGTGARSVVRYFVRPGRERTKGNALPTSARFGAGVSISSALRITALISLPTVAASKLMMLNGVGLSTFPPRRRAMASTRTCMTFPTARNSRIPSKVAAANSAERSGRVCPAAGSGPSS